MIESFTIPTIIYITFFIYNQKFIIVTPTHCTHIFKLIKSYISSHMIVVYICLKFKSSYLNNINKLALSRIKCFGIRVYV